jgi:hypothetical protein
MKPFLPFTLLFGVMLSGHSAQTASQEPRDLDRNEIRLGWMTPSSLDRDVKDADFIGILRLVDRGIGPYFGAMGTQDYDGARLDVLHVLFGEAAETLNANYRVNVMNKQSPEHPPLGSVMIAVAKKRASNFYLTRYLYPTPENLALVSRLIREYRAKELAKNPEAVVLLEKALAVPLDAYQHKSPPPSPVEPTPAIVTPSSRQEWHLWLGGMLALALIAAAWRWWRRGRCRKDVSL